MTQFTHAVASPDPLLAGLLRHILAVGVALVLLLPAARGMNGLLGWMPLWLVGMPAMALWALYRFPLPRREAVRAPRLQPRRATRAAQARRRVRSAASRRARAA